MHAPAGGQHPIPPGVFYLCVCPSLHDIMFLPGEIWHHVSSRWNSYTAGKLSERIGCHRKWRGKFCCYFEKWITIALFTSFFGYNCVKSLSSINSSSFFALCFWRYNLGTAALHWDIARLVLIKKACCQLSDEILSCCIRWQGVLVLACDLITWKAYITACASNWFSDVDVDTLKRVAVALRMWYEHDLAVALQERGVLHLWVLQGSLLWVADILELQKFQSVESHHSRLWHMPNRVQRVKIKNYPPFLHHNGVHHDHKKIVPAGHHLVVPAFSYQNTWPGLPVTVRKGEGSWADQSLGKLLPACRFPDRNWTFLACSIEFLKWAKHISIGWMHLNSQQEAKELIMACCTAAKVTIVLKWYY